MGFTLYQQQVFVDQQKKDMAFMKDHLEGLYRNSAAENARTYTIMDTIVRIFHYAKPHAGPTRGCPECAEIMKQSKPKKRPTNKRPVLVSQ